VRAIHGPGQENEPGSATCAIPSPSPPSHRDTVGPVAGSSPGGRLGQVLERELEDRRHAGQERRHVE
jgi:hypothetical protein